MRWAEIKRRVQRAVDCVQNHRRFQQIQHVLDRYSDCQLGDAAAAMTYYFALSLFPFAIFLTEVLAHIGKNMALAGSLEGLRSLIPAPVQDFLVPMVSEITSQVRLSLLSLSAVSILWASSRGFDSFLQYMDSIYQNEEKPFLLKKALGLIFTVLLTILFAVLLILVSFGSLLLEKLAEWTHLPFFQNELLYWGRLLLPFICIELILSVVFYLLSHRKKPFRYAVYGALLPTISWLALSLGLSWYISRFTKYDLIYGSISGLILFLLWLFLSMQTLFIGAFLHAEGLRLHKRKFRMQEEFVREQKDENENEDKKTSEEVVSRTLVGVTEERLERQRLRAVRSRYSPRRRRVRTRQRNR